MLYSLLSFFFFFFNDTATTEIYTLSLHDALPISFELIRSAPSATELAKMTPIAASVESSVFFSRCQIDRKSTRLNSSHTVISYAVFCLKKKKKKIKNINSKITIQDNAAHKSHIAG